MTAELIGPKPATPRHPTPWIVNPDDDAELLDANGYSVGCMNNVELAEAIKDIVNASAAKPERKLAYLLDIEGRHWYQVGYDRFITSRKRSDAESLAQIHSLGRGRSYLDESLGPITEVYE